MTDLATADAPAESLSTTLDTTPEAGPQGAGTPRTLNEEPSLRDMIAEEVKKDEAAPKDDPEADKSADEDAGEKKAEKGAEKAEKEKAEPEAKEAAKGPERGPDGKFKGAEAPKEDGEAAKAADAETQPKSGGHYEAPKGLLPDAREKWLNTPRAVQRDIANMAQQHETELTQHREAAQRYEAIRAFDEAAMRSGRAGVHESLAEVAQLEDLMQKNPLAALNNILMRAGPRKPDGQPISLYELAHNIVANGQDNYQRTLSQQPQQQQRQPDPEVAALKAQLARVQEQTVTATVIEPFKAANPRYDELEQDIAFFLHSGKIPNSLSPSDRLAAAYDMAARINPASHANDAADETDLEPARRAAESSAPAKSIKSAPGAVTSEMEPERGGSIRDLLAQEMRRRSR